MADRAEVAAEAVNKGLGTLRLQEKLNCVRPEERRRTLEEKTTNPEARIRVSAEKECPKSFICCEF